MPCSSARSSREPASTQTPSRTVSTSGIGSVATRKPEGRVVTLMSPGPSTVRRFAVIATLLGASWVISMSRNAQRGEM